MLPRLQCPQCDAAGLRLDEHTLTCPAGHSFDLARQGYASLLTGRPTGARGDTAAMVAARERFLAADHYRPLRSTITALAAAAAPPDPGLVVDLAAGTGHYLAPVLDTFPPTAGVAFDLSTAAARRAVRAHPRAAAATTDLRRPLPVASGSVDVAISVFGPRPVPEVSRVLRADGAFVVAAALPDHLHELRTRLGTITVAADKVRRLRKSLRAFDVVDEQTVTWRLALGHHDLENLVAMGPSAHHVDPDRVRAAIADLPEPFGVTAAISVVSLRPHR